MSLFKAPNFWSFDLGRLAAGLGGEQEDQASNQPGEEHQASGSTFVACPGQFHSVGSHDVLVCASLEGLICIIQVPISDQLKQTKDAGKRQAEADNKNSSSKLGDIETTPSSENRQLLCAKQLNMPVVDLKCGYFTSALKQSIAVISFNKLIIYQVKRRQLDLISSELPFPQTDLEQRANGDGLLLNVHLFSHEIEEHHQLDLLPNEIAFDIIIVSRNHHNNKRSSKSRSRRVSGDERQLETGNTDKVGEQLHLPQRDNLIVQYTNQFLLTLVDHKKVVGHFQLLMSSLRETSIEVPASCPSDGRHLQQLAQFVGPMPIAYLRAVRHSSIVITLSNQVIYCVPLAKLGALAKQSIVQRVAKNLLHGAVAGNEPRSVARSPAENSPDYPSLINVDLESEVSWKFELACEPIQMVAVQRITAEEFIAGGSSSASTYSQLLVMSRYNLDLFSSAGAHIWSQCFETPLICIYSYVLESASSNETKPKAGFPSDRLISLVCVDCLSADKSNLLVMEEERTVWSAQLDCKPAKVWRTNLQQMTGTIASLNFENNLLSCCYLGTNSETVDDEIGDLDESGGNDIAKLEQLNEPLFSEDQPQLTQTQRTKLDSDDSTIEDESRKQKRDLIVQVRMEAAEQWPNMTVESCISIKPETGAAIALQNIIVVVEFDELFKFEQSSDYPSNWINEGALEIKLGSCWADRCEPLMLKGKFSIRDSTSAEAAEALSGSMQQVSSNWMPRSLRVDLQFRFTESRLGFWFQNESFLLPLNMIARLALIDYSIGQNQSLEDVQSNLSMYKRCPSSHPNSLPVDEGIEKRAATRATQPYFFCDLLIGTQCDLIDLVDDLIESDLICRELSLEAPDYSVPRQRNKSRKLSTLENIGLLGQSLDCRLKYKSLPHTKSLLKESSIDEIDRQIVMISIALKMPSLSELMKGIDGDKSTKFTTVWLHLCDLAAPDSCIPEEIIRQHMEEWKIYNTEVEEQSSSGFLGNKSNCSILVSIESEFPAPILFLEQHLIERLNKHLIKQANLYTHSHLQSVNEDIVDSININFKNILELDNLVAIDAQLHDQLKLSVEEYEINLKSRYTDLKKDLDIEFGKFNEATMESLSLSKQLSKMPTEMQQEFNNLSALTRQYQANLNRILSELEKLKRLGHSYRKIPSAFEILLESQNGLQQRWPSLARLTDWM